MNAPQPRAPERDDADEAERARLAEAHPGWRIWRTHDDRGRPAAWMATRLADDDVEPTLHAATAEALEQLLAAPGRRFGRPLIGGTP